MHVAGGLPLEQTAVRAKELGWAEVSAVAIFKRLRKAEKWVTGITQWLLERQNRHCAGAVHWPQKWRVRLIDASHIREPGSTGTDLRLHHSIRLPELVCDHLELTDEKGGEKLARFSFAPAELAIADRGYSHRAGIAHVLRSGGDALIRWNPHSFPLENEDGTRCEILPFLRSFKDKQPGEKTVWFTAGSECFKMRLCALRKSRTATQLAQKKRLQEAKRKGNTLREHTLELAAYVLIITSAEEEKLSRAEVLELYRGRWQIERALKRLKSLLDAGHVPKKNEDSARAWMQGKIMTALLIEHLLWAGKFNFPLGLPPLSAKRSANRSAKRSLAIGTCSLKLVIL
jgi:hypothetical protein